MIPTPKFLVTAGSTREKIDAVRDWGNIFTGQTGLDIALELLSLGNVWLMTSNAEHAGLHADTRGSAGELKISKFSTHAELDSLLQAAMRTNAVNAVFMSAAVSDYQPAGVFQILNRQIDSSNIETWTVQSVQAPKVKSSHPAIAVLGCPTAKLIDKFRNPWQFNGLLVKFKLEVQIAEESLIAIAQNSRLHSHADYIVANTLAMVSGSAAAAYIIGPDLPRRVARAALPAALCQLAADYLARRRT